MKTIEQLVPFIVAILCLGYFCKLGWLMVSDYVRYRNSNGRAVGRSHQDYFFEPFLWPVDLARFLRAVVEEARR